MKRPVPLLVLGLAAAVAGCAGVDAPPPPPEARADVVARGEALARARCATCHAVGRTDTSPLAEAPPLREIGARYPVEHLAEAFAEGIMVAHDGPMPAFEFDPDEIEAVLAYLRSLEEEAG